MKHYETLDIDGRMYRRLALVSDTHGTLDPDIARKLSEHDCIVHAGDVGGALGFGDFEQPLYAVYGNNDVAAKWPASELGVLKRLPECLRIALPGGVLVVIHGHQFASAKTRHHKLRQCFSDARAIVYGHSHRLAIDTLMTPWVLNPGASGLKRTFGGASFLDLRISGGRWAVREKRL